MIHTCRRFIGNAVIPRHRNTITSILCVLVLVSQYLSIFVSPVFASDKLYFIHTDHLGSTVAVTDEDGEVVSQNRHFPYGSDRNSSSVIRNSTVGGGRVTNDELRITERSYTSQIQDRETSFYYYNARYYDPALGVFVSADLVNDQRNRYMYVGGNPLRYIDPSGYVLWPPDDNSDWQSSVITLATYNILWKGQTDEKLDSIADFIIRNNIDVIGFQEFYGFHDDLPTAWAPEWVDRWNGIEYLQSKLEEGGWSMPHSLGLDMLDRDTQILSRYPITGSRDYNVAHARGATIQINGVEEINVVAVHPHPGENPSERVTELLGLMQNSQTFILGDFNMNLSQIEDHTIYRDYYNACPSCLDTVNDVVVNRFGGTTVQDYAIDHILTGRNSGWGVINAFVDYSATASDHFPVVATFGK